MKDNCARVNNPTEDSLSRMRTPLFECVECHIKDDEERHIIDHVCKYHVPPGRAPLTCSLCKFQAMTERRLLQHVSDYQHVRALQENPCQAVFGIKSADPYVIRLGVDYIQVFNNDVKQDRPHPGIYWPKRKRHTTTNMYNNKLPRLSNMADVAGRGRTYYRPSQYSPSTRDDQSFFHDRSRARDYDDWVCRGYRPRDGVSRNRYRDKQWSATAGQGDNMITSSTQNGVRSEAESRQMEISTKFEFEYAAKAACTTDSVSTNHGKKTTSSASIRSQNDTADDEDDSQGKMFQTADINGNLDIVNGNLVTDTMKIVNHEKSAKESASGLKNTKGSVSGDIGGKGLTNYDIDAKGSAHGDIDTKGYVNGHIDANALIKCDMDAEGPVEKDIKGSVSGDIDAKRTGDADVKGSVIDDTDAKGSINGDADVKGSVNGDADDRGPLNGAKASIKVSLNGDTHHNESPTRQTSSEHGTQTDSCPEDEAEDAHDNCADDEEDEDEDAVALSRFEGKVTQLIASLEPLKNIAKGLIAMDNHMRFMIPLMEAFLKNPSAVPRPRKSSSK